MKVFKENTRHCHYIHKIFIERSKKHIYSEIHKTKANDILKNSRENIGDTVKRPTVLSFKLLYPRVYSLATVVMVVTSVASKNFALIHLEMIK